jgi:hypothetical protein
MIKSEMSIIKCDCCEKVIGHSNHIIPYSADVLCVKCFEGGDGG